jgi:hypothetical protein
MGAGAAPVPVRSGSGTPPQECANAADRFEQSGVFDESDGRTGLARFGHKKVWHRGLSWFLALRAAFGIGDLRRQNGIHLFDRRMRQFERARNQQLFHLSVGQGFQSVFHSRHG